MTEEAEAALESNAEISLARLVRVCSPGGAAASTIFLGPVPLWDFAPRRRHVQDRSLPTVRKPARRLAITAFGRRHPRAAPSAVHDLHGVARSSSPANTTPPAAAAERARAANRSFQPGNHGVESDTAIILAANQRATSNKCVAPAPPTANQWPSGLKAIAPSQPCGQTMRSAPPFAVSMRKTIGCG